MFGEVEAALGDCDLVKGLLTAGAFELIELLLNRLFVAKVVDVSKLKENQAEDRSAVLRSLEIGVGTQVVGGCPKVGFELFELVMGQLFSGKSSRSYSGLEYLTKVESCIVSVFSSTIRLAICRSSSRSHESNHDLLIDSQLFSRSRLVEGVREL